jgi:hypothetical protein
MLVSNQSCRDRLVHWSATILGLCLLSPMLGCATWLPTAEEPAAPSRGEFIPPTVSDNSAGVETILLRLTPEQSQSLPALWSQVDEQVLTPKLRTSLDKNGIRAGMVSGAFPAMLDEWLKQTLDRVSRDPLEQSGLAADVSSYAQLWRCRANARKELTIRNLSHESLSVTSFAQDLQEHIYQKPHFMFAIEAVPVHETSAHIRLTPMIQHGELLRKPVPRESGIHLDSLRESVEWSTLTFDLKMQAGECLLIGPTSESRALGEHFFHTKIKSGEIQPVLLLVRLSELNRNDTFMIR